MQVRHDNPASVTPPPRDAYSHAVRVELGTAALLFVAGQIALDPDGAVRGDMTAQSEHVMTTLDKILAAHGASFDHVVNIRSFLTDLDQLPAYGEVRRRYLTGDRPTSTTVEVAKLFHPDALLEVDLVAAIPA
ncbi:MAG: RidA family protein [Micromonosporaceae bacterium]